MILKLLIPILTLWIAVAINAFGQWTHSGNLQNTYINSLNCDSGIVYAATGGAGFFYSTNEGANWIQANNGLGQNLNTTSVTNTENDVFVSTISAGVFKSSKPGSSWTSATAGITQNNVVDLVSDANSVYAGCILAGVFRTTNNGNTWTRYALGEGDLLYCLHLNETGFFIGLAGGGFRTTNGGLNWSFFGSGLLNSNLFALDSGPGFLYAGTDEGFFYSNDAGSSWTQEINGLPKDWLNDIQAVNGYILASVKNAGIYYTSSNGQSWFPFNNGMADTNITCLAASDEFIYAGSNRGNVYRAPVQSLPVGILQQPVSLPQNFTLQQNYPNPFNPTTLIRFTLNRNSFVVLEIYDIQGRRISELLKNDQPSGSYEIPFSGNSLAGGVYLCRLTVGDHSESVRIVLLK